MGFFFFSSANICNFFFFFFFSEIYNKHLWVDGGPSIQRPSGPSGQRWAQIGDRGGRRNSFKLFSSPPVSMVYCRTRRAWLLLCSSPCASWSTMLQCVPSWHNRATLLLIVSPAISGRILVHHNYWGGPQFPHILTSLWWRWGYSQKGTILCRVFIVIVINITISST